MQLPGGRQIEVVYLDSAHDSLEQELSQVTSPPRASTDTPIQRRADTPSATPEMPLHICPGCGGRFVHPLDWVEESPGRWGILLRCPDCDLQREGVFGQVLVERLDEELDRATGALLSDLRQLTHANMAEELELFSRALQLDLIGPHDF